VKTSKLDAKWLRRLTAAVVLSFLFVMIISIKIEPPNAFASPLVIPTPVRNQSGIHLGSHVVAEPWTEELLTRIDGDKPGGKWPDTVVFLSSNLYNKPRNQPGDCKINSVSGKYDLTTGTGNPLGYLQRASKAGVKIIIRIWPSPGNFILPSYRISLSNQPANGDRCDDGSNSQGGNRSYDDVGDEIIKLHQWNLSHGITESGFLPANEPNREWYALIDNPIGLQNPIAWNDMDAYFTAVYTYVHAISFTSPITVLTPPMAQETWADIVDINGCTDRGFHGYEYMPLVFLYGVSNDGYAWNNYWNIGYEAWAYSCRADYNPHGHHVSMWFPLAMHDNMANKPSYIIEADLKSPTQNGALENKDDQLGVTASNSISQFLAAEGYANHMAVWALNVTNANETEQNWHEAYACNDWNWATGTGKGLGIERPWFTRWWTGETASYSVTPCYRVLLPVGVKDYPEELIKNGQFESESAYWTVSRLPSCQRPMFKVYTDTNGIENYAAVLGDCQGNIDTLYQIVTIPSNAASAKLRYNYELITGYAGGTPTAYMDVFLVDGSTPHLLDHYDDSGYDPVKNVWQSRTIDLMPYVGKTVQVKFYASNSSAGWPAKFWVDNVSLLVEH
jgi:hypothetical protein